MYDPQYFVSHGRLGTIPAYLINKWPFNETLLINCRSIDFNLCYIVYDVIRT